MEDISDDAAEEEEEDQRKEDGRTPEERRGIQLFPKGVPRGRSSSRRLDEKGIRTGDRKNGRHSNIPDNCHSLLYQCVIQSGAVA